MIDNSYSRNKKTANFYIYTSSDYSDAYHNWNCGLMVWGVAVQGGIIIKWASVFVVGFICG